MSKDNKRVEEKILTWLLNELRQAEEKHPKWPKDDIHAAAIVAEEAGELVRASLQSVYESGHDSEMFKEAVQTGAMSIRFLKNLLKRERP